MGEGGEENEIKAQGKGQGIRRQRNWRITREDRGPTEIEGAAMPPSMEGGMSIGVRGGGGRSTGDRLSSLAGGSQGENPGEGRERAGVETQ